MTKKELILKEIFDQNKHWKNEISFFEEKKHKRKLFFELLRYVNESIYRKTIEYDIPRIFGVDKIDELRFIYKMLINENGNILEYKTISAEAGIEENTLKKYLYYFEESFLLDIIYNYSKSFRKSRRLQKKGYIASSNFYAAIYRERFENIDLFNQYFGGLAESYVLHLLNNKYQHVAFFRKRDKEIDFIAGQDFSDKNNLALCEVILLCFFLSDIYSVAIIAKRCLLAC
ncbi:MAG: DUF4143 domain-containing protein [bacterium]